MTGDTPGRRALFFWREAIAPGAIILVKPDGSHVDADDESLRELKVPGTRQAVWEDFIRARNSVQVDGQELTFVQWHALFVKGRRDESVTGPPPKRRRITDLKTQCAYCGKRFPREELSKDHVIPRSKLDRLPRWLRPKVNIVDACKSCNSRKSDKLVVPAYIPDWLRKKALPQWLKAISALEDFERSKRAHKTTADLLRDVWTRWENRILELNP